MRENFSRFIGQKDDGDERVEQIRVESITPNPHQPRTVFDDERLDELCHTIEVHGIIQPIIVRAILNNRYELVAGERRWRAAMRLGLPTVPAIIKDYTDDDTASIALIENLQREDLTPIEEALAYQKLIEVNNLTQENLAKRLGKKQSTIGNKLRLLNLPEFVQSSLAERKITERHGRALLPLRDQALQGRVLQEILEKNLNVQQTEQRVAQLLNKEKSGQRAKPRIFAFSRDARIAINTIRESLAMIEKTGLNVETIESDCEDYYEFKIRIPK